MAERQMQMKPDIHFKERKMKNHPSAQDNSDTYLTPTYARDYFSVPNNDLIIEQESKDPRAVQQSIYNRIDLDARNSSDLGSYICDYMDPECDELIKRTIGKVYIDHSEYPQTSYLGDAVAAMIQSWYGGTPLTPQGANNHKIIGTVTIGSSEAIMLALMAHRQNWYDAWFAKYNASDDPNSASDNWYHDVPLLMYGREVHTCWDKYSKYYNVPALVFNLKEGQYLIDPDDVKTYLNMSLSDVYNARTSDPNCQRFWKVLYEALKLPFNPGVALDKYMSATYLRDLVCCVGGVVGTTFTGQGGPIEGINSVLTTDVAVSPTGYKIPIHVDAASGGFVVPFTDPGEDTYRWTFSLERVKSINVSNHKFGMVYPGCGTIVFKDENVVPDSLIYKITYLGGNFTDYTVNFSRGSAMVLAAYYNLKRFGLDGFEKLNTQCVRNAQYLAGKIADVKDSAGNALFNVISDTAHYPMVVWEFNPSNTPSWTLFQLSTLLEQYAWKLPAYNLPFNSSEQPDGTTVMRVVTRQDISAEKIDILVDNIQTAVSTLEGQIQKIGEENAKGFLRDEQRRLEFKGSGDYR